MENEAKNEAEQGQPEGEQPKEKPYCIMALTEYEDTKGRRVREQVPVAGDVDHTWARFVGYVNYRIQAGPEVLKVDTEIPIPAETVEEAFAKFDEVAQGREPEVRKNVMNQIREKQRRIVTAPAGAMPPGGNGQNKRIIM